MGSESMYQIIHIITVMGSGPRMIARSAECYWFDGEQIYSRINPSFTFRRDRDPFLVTELYLNRSGVSLQLEEKYSL